MCRGIYFLFLNFLIHKALQNKDFIIIFKFFKFFAKVIRKKLFLVKNKFLKTNIITTLTIV